MQIDAETVCRSTKLKGNHFIERSQPGRGAMGERERERQRRETEERDRKYNTEAREGETEEMKK